jgi:hypothetical protein
MNTRKKSSDTAKHIYSAHAFTEVLLSFIFYGYFMMDKSDSVLVDYKLLLWQFCVTELNIL